MPVWCLCSCLRTFLWLECDRLARPVFVKNPSDQWIVEITTPPDDLEHHHYCRLIPGLGLRATGGKGELNAECAQAMADAGCVYLAFLGGGAEIITAGIKQVTGIGWPEMISHYRIARIEVERLGPLTVGIDAHGNSIYDQTTTAALQNRQAILDEMRAAREG